MFRTLIIASSRGAIDGKVFAYSTSWRDVIQPQTPRTHFSMQHSQDDAQKSDTNQTQADMECSVLSETSLPSVRAQGHHRG